MTLDNFWGEDPSSQQNSVKQGLHKVRAAQVAVGQAEPTAYLDPLAITRPAALPELGPSETVTITYAYDGLDRLIATDYSNGIYFHYTYDAVGNQLSEETFLGTKTYAYDSANRLTHVGSQAYTWDAKGNLLSDGEYTYTYNHANRLTAVTGGTNTYTCTYNGDGTRTSATTHADGVRTDYVVDIAGGFSQVLSDGEYTYLYGNGRIAQVDSDSTEYFLGDALGSVRQLVDAQGVVTLGQSYVPYGEVMVSLGSGQTSYAFTGEEYDGNTGLVYLRARYYSSGSGRFISEDIWAGNDYNPVSYNKWL